MQKLAASCLLPELNQLQQTSTDNGATDWKESLCAWTICLCNQKMN